MNFDNKNTKRNYLHAFSYFQSQSGLSESELKEKKPSELNKLIDSIICGNKRWSNRSKRLYISAVRTVLDYQFDVPLPRSKVSKSLKTAGERKTNKTELTKEQVMILQKYFENNYKTEKKDYLKVTHLRNLILFKLLAGTGQRISDILNLKVAAAKKQDITFLQEKTKAIAKVENPCQQEIFLYVSIQRLSDDDFLFANDLQRNPLHRTQAYRVISDAGKLVLSIKNLSPHCLRAYFVTELKKRNVSNLTIMSATGHINEGMISYYYTGKPELKGSAQLLLGFEKEKKK